MDYVHAAGVDCVRWTDHRRNAHSIECGGQGLGGIKKRGAFLRVHVNSYKGGTIGA